MKEEAIAAWNKRAKRVERAERAKRAKRAKIDKGFHNAQKT